MTGRLVAAYLSSRTLKVVAVVLLIVAVALTMLGTPWQAPLIPYRIDLEVYWLGGTVLREGGDLYGLLPDLSEGGNLPFTYPPLAAVLFAPLSMLPLVPATVIHTFGTVSALAVTVYAVLARIAGPRLSGGPGGTRAVLWLAVAATALGLATGPLRETVGFGQVNAMLMALVVVDCLYGRGRWWGGLLVGLAAAIKLTPATMLVYFVVRRDWRSLATAVVGAAAFTGIGHLLTPENSARYWSATLSDPARIGRLEFSSNQSVNGVVHRLGLGGDDATLVWFAVSVVLGLLVWLGAWLLARRGENTAAAILVSFIALLCSPVSWGHHWVWAVPMLVILIWWGVRSADRVWGWLAATGVLVFVATPQWWFPHDEGRELAWSWPEHLLGNAYLVWALVLLGVVIHRSLTTDGARAGVVIHRTDEDADDERRSVSSPEA